MKKYKPGDIVFVSKYAYSNGKFGNNHLFVLIDDDNNIVPVEYFEILISSHREKLKFNTNAKLNKTYLNGLNVDSIYKISSKNILFKIGQVDVDDYIHFLKVL